MPACPLFFNCREGMDNPAILHLEDLIAHKTLKKNNIRDSQGLLIEAFLPNINPLQHYNLRLCGGLIRQSTRLSHPVLGRAGAYAGPAFFLGSGQAFD